MDDIMHNVIQFGKDQAQNLHAFLSKINQGIKLEQIKASNPVLLPSVKMFDDIAANWVLLNVDSKTGTVVRPSAIYDKMVLDAIKVVNVVRRDAKVELGNARGFIDRQINKLERAKRAPQ
jgi:hypothetical protein